MEIHHQIECSSGFDDAVIPLDHPLILAGHKVDLDPGDAPLLELREKLHKVSPLNIGPIKPQPELHPFFSSIAPDLIHIHRGIHARNIGSRPVKRPIPLPVDQLIGPTHISGKADIAFDGLGIHLDLSTPPMVPCHHPRIDPRRVFNRTWLIEVENEII